MPAGDVVYRLSTAGCVQIDTLQDERGTAWVTPPATLSDYDLFCKAARSASRWACGRGCMSCHPVIPSPLRPSSLRMQATLRDCDTLLPRQSSGRCASRAQ